MWKITVPSIFISITLESNGGERNLLLCCESSVDWWLSASLGNYSSCVCGMLSFSWILKELQSLTCRCQLGPFLKFTWKGRSRRGSMCCLQKHHLSCFSRSSWAMLATTNSNKNSLGKISTGPMEIIASALMSVSPPHGSLLLVTGPEDTGRESTELVCSSKATQLQLGMLRAPGCRSITVCFWFHPWYQPVARVQRCLGCLDFQTCFIPVSSYPPLVSGGRAVRSGTIASLNNFLTLQDEMWATEKSAAACYWLQQDWRFTCDVCWQQGERDRGFEEWVSEYVHAVLARLMKIQKATEIL